MNPVMRPLGCLDAASAISIASRSRGVARRRIEIQSDRVPVAGLPRTRAEHSPEDSPDACLGIFIGPSLTGPAKVADGRHAALQEFRRGYAQAGRVYSDRSGRPA